MITLKNISAVVVVPILSMIFLASSARADETWSGKDRSSHHEQKVKPPKPENHQKRSDQETRRNQGIHRDRDENAQQVRRNFYFTERPYYRPVQVFSYVNIAPPVEYSTQAPSIGGFVDSLPAGYLSITINGVLYAVYQGVFYEQVSSGYQAVDISTLVFNGPFSLGILNSGGVYIQIPMKAVGNGFIGPQGEFYPQFPPIRQLRAMYVR